MIQKVISFIFVFLLTLSSQAQTFKWRQITMTDSVEEVLPQKKIYIGVEGDTLLFDSITPVPAETLPTTFFMPAIFDTYHYLDTMAVGINSIKSTEDSWVTKATYQSQLLQRVKQQYMIDNPQYVQYNLSMLPEPPKKFVATVDPAQSIIVIKEAPIDKSQLSASAPVEEMKYRNWLHSFDGSLQFSQAYISPNWYQGGNNNVNMIASGSYGIKLNQAFHPNILFETNVQYKIALASTSTDSLRNYTISEDLFLLTSKVGFKALKRWYYTFNMSLKTQFFKNYKPNTNDLKAAFMAPGEVNIGVGMTYDYSNKKKTVVFGASLSPLSYNLKTCLRSDMDETSFGIKEGRHTVSQVGSSAEFKLNWKIAYNIQYQSRLFVFSNYQYVQGDWENTLSFSINRFLSTQLYVHLRYDSSTTPIEDWKDWQLKEILSFGFSYRFSMV